MRSPAMNRPGSNGFNGSERTQLDVFTITEDGISPRDQRDLMERPFFSLMKGKRTVPIHYTTNDIEVHVFGLPEHGMATIWDADILIWAASQIVAAANRGFKTSRLLRFTPYQLLSAIHRATGATEYRLLKAALARLQSTVIATTIRNGEQWRRQQFSWINEWAELKTRSGRHEGIECVLPDWFYRGVIDRSLVLTIDPAYFHLKGGIERWLYRLVRKHAGHQPQGWRFELRHLHAKSGSLARFSDFALDIRRIAHRQAIPHYHLSLHREKEREILHAKLAELSTVIVDKTVDCFVISGAQLVDRDVRSGASEPGHQAHEQPKNTVNNSEVSALNLYNFKESNCCRATDGLDNTGLDKAPPAPGPDLNNQNSSICAPPSEGAGNLRHASWSRKTQSPMAQEELF